MSRPLLIRLFDRLTFDSNSEQKEPKSVMEFEPSRSTACATTTTPSFTIMCSDLVCPSPVLTVMARVVELEKLHPVDTSLKPGPSSALNTSKANHLQEVMFELTFNC